MLSRCHWGGRLIQPQGGEVTDLTIWDPDRGGGDRSLVSVHATPARFEEASQVASTKHKCSVIDLVSHGGTMLRGRWLQLFYFSKSWAWSHSSATDNPFVAISTRRLVLASKISLFLAVHRNQQVQGSTSDRIPVGERQSACLKRNTADLKYVSSAMWTGDLRGTLRQTSFAKVQWKKICIDVSNSLQWGQMASEVIPLRCSYAHMGMAPCMIDQRTRVRRSLWLCLRIVSWLCGINSRLEWDPDVNVLCSFLAWLDILDLRAELW